MDIKDEKIKRCIACPVAHKFLSTYLEYYKLKTENKEKIDEKIKIFSNILNLEGEYKDWINLLTKLTSPKMNINEITRNIEDYSDCFQTLNSIIYPLKNLFFESSDPTEVIRNFKVTGVKILDYIIDFLQENNVEVESLTPEEKEWTNKYLMTLGKKSKKEEALYTKKLEQEDEEYLKKYKKIRAKKDKKAQITYHKFKNILKTYCNLKSEKLNFKYCNPMLLSNDKYDNCKFFLFYKRTELKTNGILISKKINHLKQEYQNIIHNYLLNAPKKIADILAKLIDLQGLSDQDIITLLWGKFETTSDSLQLPKYIEPKKSPYSIRSICNSDKPEISYEEKNKLAKILLVSNEMLKSGKGKIYGNWNSVLKPKNNEDKNTLKEYFKKKYDISKTKEIEHAVKARIYELINLSDSDFKKTIKENSFFCEDDFCVYTYNEYGDRNGEEYYDYDLMYENLIHPEDFDTLLSVLEELQAQENN